MSGEAAEIAGRRRELGAALATFRQAAGMSQAQLGAGTHYDRTSVNKIEFWLAVDRLLAAEGALLERYDGLVVARREQAQQRRSSTRVRHQADADRLRGAVAVVSPSTPASPALEAADHRVSGPERDPVLAAPWSPRGTVEAAVVLRGGDGRVRRRDFVLLTGPALTAPAHQWLICEPGPLLSGLAGRRVSGELVTRLGAMVGELRRTDDVAGGGSVLAMATQQFGWVADLLDHARYDEPTGRALHVLLADLGRMCGWSAYEAGHQALAQRYYIAGLRAAHTVDDRPFGGHILAYMAHQAETQGQPAEAVTFIETALAGTRGWATPALLAQLHSGQARAFAALRNASACSAAISQARTQVEQLQPDDDPSWLYWMGPANITVGAGNCFLQLGQPERAVALLDEGIAQFSESFVRERQIGVTRQAEARARPGKQQDLHAAAGLGMESIDLAESLDSNRATTLLRDLHNQLTPHGQVPAVREFLERTKEFLAT